MLIPLIAVYLSGELQLKHHSDYVFENKKSLIDLDWVEVDLPILKEFYFFRLRKSLYDYFLDTYKSRFKNILH
jgi:hypothetical protein